MPLQVDNSNKLDHNSNLIIQSILSVISQADTFDDLSQKIVKTCAEMLDAEVCTLWRRYTDQDGVDRLRLAAASAKAPQTIAQEAVYEIRLDPSGKDADGVTGYVAQTGKEVHVKSFKELMEKYRFVHKGKIDKIQWGGKPEDAFKSLYAVPLTLGTKIVGVLKLENKHGSKNGFSKQDRTILLQVVPYIAIAVHSLKLLDSHERRLIEAPALFAEELLKPFEVHDLMRRIVETTAKILNAEVCTLWLVKPERSELQIEAYYGFEVSKEKIQTYTLNWDAKDDKEIEGITAWVAIKKIPFWANSWEQLKEHPSWKGKWDRIMWKEERSFRCLYAVPLIREKEVKGVLKVENRKGMDSFTETDKVLFNIMASFIVQVLELGQQFRLSMVSDLAHIIRSPIGQVVINLSGLKRELAKESPNKGRTNYYIELIKRAVLAINVTSKTLSAFAGESLTSKKEILEEPVSLRDLVQKRIDEVKPLVPTEMEIIMHMGLDNDLIKLSIIDQTNFNIIIDNILHNAIKFSPPHGVIEIRLFKKDSKIFLTIQDHGRGILPEDLPHVFEPGFKRRATGQPDSVGMGLATVRKLLNRLGWEHYIESTPGEGTIFTIIIPLSNFK